MPTSARVARTVIRCLLALTLLASGVPWPAAAQERSATPEASVPEREKTAADVNVEKEVRPPFGASLFARRSTAGVKGPNPEYLVQRGDKVAVFVWGAKNFSTVAEVDPAGNIFLEDVGPVPVAGVRSGSLNEHIGKHVRNLFRENVDVYATLVDSRSIGVFVTGFVAQPGRYPGYSSESVIDFLLKAGGIDFSRGSFRDIVVTRGRKTLAHVDLYDFLLDGRLAQVQFKEGDTILVREQRATVTVDGDIRNNYQFEFPPRGTMTGAELIRLARPLPRATHALLEGVRAATPYSAYLTLGEFRNINLQDQDRAYFDADAREETVTVRISGSHLGSSVFVADPDATVQQLLDYVQVDPNLANTAAVHMKRKRVALQQKAALDDALDRLQRTVMTSTAPTAGSAKILQTEANLITKYVDMVRQAEPQGIVVLANQDGQIADLRLEDGDEIVIPLHSQIIIIGGEVIAPQTLVFQSDIPAAEYVDLAGGYTERAEKGTFIVRHPNGRVEVSQDPDLGAGDELIVPPKVGGKGWQIALDLSQILFQAVFAAAVVTDR